MNATTPFKVVGTRPVRPDGADKVTGRAKFGADFALPGMLVGKVLRSPHAHARIRAIRTERALAMPGVKAVVTGADLADIPAEWVGNGRVEVNFRHLTLNVLARDKVLYEGHAVAAVAATTAEIAAAALAAIEVDYAVLPHVIDVSEAMKPDAPLLHEDMITRGVTPAPTKPSNIAKRVEIATGDVAAGFAQAEVVIERHFTTAAVHQGYIEPTATLAAVAADGECTVWTATQGHFQVRAHCARMLGIDISKVRVIPAEIGGGFGGKLNVYIEPVALALARKSGRPVKIVMGRDEVFKGTGPTSGSAISIKVGAMRDGRIVAGEATFAFQAGAFPGSPVMNACMVAFGSYAIPNVRTVGYDVVTNRPKSAAYRAPGAPIAGFAAEGVLDELAERLGMDPIALRQKNVAREGVTTPYGQTFGKIGFAEVLEAARKHPHYSAPLGPNQGRGFACGFWFNGGGESSAALNVNEDGTAILITGSPDLSGTRASLAMMAAEELGVPVERINPVVGDTSSIAYTGISAGSRVTFATGKAVVEASRAVIKELCRRAARIWKVDEEGVEWKDGQARPAGDNVGKFPALSLKEIAGKALATGGPIGAQASISADGIGPAFGAHLCDVEVDPETGRTTLLRYTIVQDVGRAIHPAYVESQMQGGAVQGIGWALNEEYVYGRDGKLQNAGFLDYRMPVFSDLPMIDAVLVEVPNPGHPYGVRGVGETPIVPPLGAVANAVSRATGVRMTRLPLSPPSVLAAIDAARPARAAE